MGGRRFRSTSGDARSPCSTASCRSTFGSETAARRGTRSLRRRSLDAGRLARDRRRGGVLARVWTSGPPDTGTEIPDRKAATQEIRVSYALNGHCAPRSQCVGGPEGASARGQRPHPLDVQRQTHQVPLAAHLRQASQAESSESKHFLDPPVRRLREPLALRVLGLAPRLASFSPMRCVAGSRAGSTATRDLPADSGPTRSPNPAQADHRFRFNPITNSGRTRSPIPVPSRSLFLGGRNRSGRLV